MPPRKIRVLIVDDAVVMRRLLTEALKRDPRIEVVGTAPNGRIALQKIPQVNPDLVTLDMEMPDLDGLSTLRELRRTGHNEPILILSARDAVQDRIHGLNLGADDYLPKPFSIEELLARLRSLLRRHQTGPRQTTLAHANLHLDLLSRTLTRDGQPIELTNREHALIELFLQNPGRVLTRTLIAEKIWETSYDIETNLIDVYVRRLRAKLETDRPLIKTIRGSGYVFAKAQD